ncbi:microspherule protein 1 isoform X1 [Oncorhynchus nerka]|uniref:microspherule protein 1 isoform X1 n=1 Tax=Oncorhynchus nerka TaxID=8023 RepID=UPI0011322105|nr:microspherule protein 1 isoform X1 [Oncorhynchus nerka]
MEKDMQAGATAASVVGAPMGAAGTQSRSEDEESTGMKDIKRTATQAFVGGGGVVPNRRSSSRSIKRKKFDDELVESSLAKSSSRVKGPPVIEPIRCSGSEPSSNEKKKDKTHDKLQPADYCAVYMMSKSSTALTPPLTMVITPPPIAKRVKKSKQPLQITKDLGRWKPTDDLLLINAVLQTTDLTSVHLGVKFSCRFTLREIQERWYSLLYDPVISKLAWQAMRQLHPEAIAAIQSKALFGQAEEALLAKIASSSQPKLEVFQELLSKHPSVFYPSRTPKSLLVHWQLLKQYYLLEDQSVQPFPKGDQVLNFSDAEQLVDDAKLKESRDEVLEHELMISDRHQKKEIRQLEQELPRWQVLVDSITGMNSPDFDNQTLAALRGRMVRYLMRSREITLGRATKDKQIDVDLSLEGPAWKISRKQGIIKLKNNGDFFIANEGRRPIYIDGRPVLSGNKWKLNNNSVVEIAGLRFVFLINQELISLIKAEAAKMNQQ